ncbi:MAG: IS3 family transposase [Brevinemataceae bacterium]
MPLILLLWNLFIGICTRIYSSFDQEKQSLFRHILKKCYNTQRIHSSLNYLSPQEFEK